MICRRLSFALLTLASSASLLATPLTLYVATDGNDGWTGALPGPAANKQDGPLATLSAAVKAARKARTNSVHAGDAITILVRGGAYELAEPIQLTPEDSGVDTAHPFTIANYKDEKPVLSGGRRLTDWLPVSGRRGWWRAPIRDENWRFRQLFVDGQRKQRARAPNAGFYRIDGESPRETPAKFKFKPGEIKPAWADDGEVEVIALLAWAEFRMQVRAVDVASNIVTLSGAPRRSNREDNAQYFIENAPDALDQPGEWYLNRRMGMVTYIAQPGEDMSKVETVAPRLTELLRMRGDFRTNKPVHDVVLRGLTFSHTDWTLDQKGHADTQAAISIRGAVILEGAADCVIEDCVFARLGGYALDLGRGSRRCKAIGNEMFDLGAGGIRVGEVSGRPGPLESNEGHVVTDNHIRDGGKVYPSGVGILLLLSGQNRVSHNYVHHLFYTGISVGWNWDYNETASRENIIEWNHVHDIGQSLLSDLAGVYTLGMQKGTVVRNNLVHDIEPFNYGGRGVYADGASSSIVFENNVVYRCRNSAFNQNFGRDNLIRNNIFAFNKESQVSRNREESALSFTFTNNIVYFDEGILFGGHWANNNFFMDNNVYFDARTNATPQSMRLADSDINRWHRRKHDVHSVIADPLFVDAKNFDFRPKPESPALKLGFKPIDLAAVGVRAKGRRD